MPSCSVHALAHILHKPIEEVALWFGEGEQPVRLSDVWKRLEREGFLLTFKLAPCYPASDWRFFAHAQEVVNGRYELAECWPCAPFAPIHFCIVREHQQFVNHAVALHEKGWVYDHLQHDMVLFDAYECIHAVVGLHRDLSCN